MAIVLVASAAFDLYFLDGQYTHAVQTMGLSVLHFAFRRKTQPRASNVGGFLPAVPPNSGQRPTLRPSVSASGLHTVRCISC